MKEGKCKVAITFDMAIDDDGEMEYNLTKETGYLFNKGNKDVLMYEEKLDEGSVKNLITIQPNKVIIKRNGSITMNQQFYPKQMTESLYHHPYGKIHMETFTNSIHYEPLEQVSGGKLLISYRAKLNGMNDRKHFLTLIYQKEDKR